MDAVEKDGFINVTLMKRYKKGDLNVRGLKVTSLLGCPLHVTGTFTCADDSELISLEHAPRYVDGALMCESLPKIKNLQGGPQQVGIEVSFMDCPQLEDLSGFPAMFGDGAGNGSVKVLRCPIRSLTGCPEHVPNQFQLQETRLENLEHGPRTAGRSYDLYGNLKLTTLRGMARLPETGRVVVNGSPLIQGYLLAFATGASTAWIEGEKHSIPANARTVFRAKLHLVQGGHKDMAFIQ